MDNVIENRSHLKIIVAALLVLAFVSGCGYHPVTARGPLAAANGVNVTVFSNKSYRPGVEGILAREMVDEMALRTGGRVLPGDRAELELTGVILTYTVLPVSYTAQDTIKEYRNVISIQATLREKQTQKVVWKGDLIEDQSFPANANVALQQNAEEAATVKICRRLSEEVWHKVGEQF